MKAPEMFVIDKLKKDLNTSIINNDYDLLSPQVLYLSKVLDELMLPLFKSQLDSSFPEI